MKKYIISLFIFALSHEALSYSFKEFNDEVWSPMTTEAKYVVATGTVVTGVLAAFRPQLVEPFQKTQVRHQILGDTSRYGDILGQLVPNAVYTAAMGFAGLRGNALASERASGMFKATAYASALTTVLKYTIREPRPYSNNVRNSFPSGHTTTAFAFGGYVAAEHGWGWGAPALAMASFVGYSRINDNKHFLLDVTAGATIGWAFGWGIAKVQQKRRREKDMRKNFNPLPESPEDKKEEDDETTPVVIPIAAKNTLGLGIQSEF